MIPVVLSGGSGTRLWPVSRLSYPKQFGSFYDQSFLKSTLERLKRFGEPRVVTVESMKELTQRVTEELKVPSDHVIYEPISKNTAPAVALVCHILEMNGMGEEVAGIFPVDHLITDLDAFENAVKTAEVQAQAGEIVTIGIQPRYPSSNYGYIEVEVESDREDACAPLQVRTFKEKPDIETARQLIRSGRDYWNAGIFIFKVSTMIERFKTLMPDMWKRISSIDPSFKKAKHAYSALEPISIDYGIMEKLDHLVCIPCPIGWSDLGSWDELAKLAEEFPEFKSDTMASVFTENALSNYVFSLRNKVIGLVGVNNLIVVDTPDALLVTQKGCGGKVKDLVSQIRRVGLPEATQHPYEAHSWGGYELLDEREEVRVRMITVDPGAELEHKGHQGQDEHWIVIKGRGFIVLEGKEKELDLGEHLYVAPGESHKLVNHKNNPLVLLEVLRNQ